MYGPLIANGFISVYIDLVFAFICGILFGFILEQGGFSSGKKITAVFYGRDFAVPKVMFTAMVTGGAGIVLLHSIGLMDATKLFLPPTFLAPHLVGGLIFGVGMVVSGYCPGTALISSSIGRIDGMVALIGMFLGTAIFNESYPLLKDFLYVGAIGKKSFVELFGLPVGFVILLMVLFALFFFWFAGRMESIFGEKKKPLLQPWTPATGRWLAALVILFAVLSGIGGMDLVPGKPNDSPAGLEMLAGLPENANAIEAEELEKLINSKTEIFSLFDLREASEYEKGALPGSYNIPLAELATADGLNLIPEDRKVILYDQDGALAFQTLLLLKLNGINVVALSGGLTAWARMKTGSGTTEYKFSTPAAKPPPLPTRKTGKSGKGGFRDEGC